MNDKQEQALEAIKNFILWYTSNETERDLIEAAKSVGQVLQEAA